MEGGAEKQEGAAIGDEGVGDSEQEEEEEEEGLKERYAAAHCDGVAAGLRHVAAGPPTCAKLAAADRIPDLLTQLFIVSFYNHFSGDCQVNLNTGFPSGLGRCTVYSNFLNYISFLQR